MAIEIKPTKASAIRQLGGLGFTREEIREATGFKYTEIDNALGRKGKFDKPKSRVAPIRKRVVEARGPLTAGEVSERLGIPYASARRMTDR